MRAAVVVGNMPFVPAAGMPMFARASASVAGFLVQTAFDGETKTGWPGAQRALV